MTDPRAAHPPGIRITEMQHGAADPAPIEVGSTADLESIPGNRLRVRGTDTIIEAGQLVIIGNTGPVIRRIGWLRYWAGRTWRAVRP